MDGSHPRTWWRSCKVFRIGAHAWICTPEEKGKLWKKHRKARCSSSKCKKFVLFSDHFCAHCGEANEKFDPVEEATNKEGQRTGWLGKRPGEFDPKSLAAEFEESFVEETKVIVGDLLADLNTRSGKGKVVADIGKVVSHKDLADIATAALKDPADIAKAAHKEPEAWVTKDHVNKSQHQNAVVSAFQRTWYPIPAGDAALPNPYAVRTGGKDGKDNGKGGGGHNDKGGGNNGKGGGGNNGKGGGIGERVALMEEQVIQQGANIRDIQQNLVLVLQVPKTITRSPRFLENSTLIPPTGFSLSENVDATPSFILTEYDLDLRVLHGRYGVSQESREIDSKSVPV